MKPFTDDERTVLEGFLNLDIDPMLSIDREKALLHRLECAEKAYTDLIELSNCVSIYHESWLASKGAKEGL